MKLSVYTSKTLGLLTFAMLLYSSNVWAGGLEKICVEGAETDERWENVPPSGLQFEIQTGPFGNLAPGYPVEAPLAVIPGGDQPVIRSFERVAETWNGVPGSTLRVDPVPSFSEPLSSLNSQISKENGRNQLTFWEQPEFFSSVGGSFVLAVAVVTEDEGIIEEADIAFNAMWLDQLDPSRATYSFVEQSATSGIFMMSNPTFEANNHSLAHPTISFVDLQGTLAHEMGHALGLAHSLVDGEANVNNSRFPTMFPVAQVESWGATYNIPGTEYVVPMPVVYQAAEDTLTGGLIGASARSLTPDDRAALAAGYPATDLDSGTGQITGQIRDYNDIPLRGASVVAIGAQGTLDGEFLTPHRIGTLSYFDGQYELTALPPGDYFIFVEPVSFGPGGYFSSTTDLPNYILPQGSSGCLNNIPRFPQEYRNTDDSKYDPSGRLVTRISVAAGERLEGVDIVLGHPLQKESLTICANPHPISGCQGSGRGVHVSQPSGATTNVVVELQANVPVGTPTYIVMNTSQDALVYQSLIFETDAASTTSSKSVPFPQVFIIPYPEGGRLTLPIPASGDLLWPGNYFIQAAYPKGGGQWEFSNYVNMWLQNM